MIDDLAAALDQHQVTNDEGQVDETSEGTLAEDSATTEEKTSEGESEQVGTTADTQTEETQTSESESENAIAEDDSGRKWIPKDRFEKVYGRMKQSERELEAMRALRGNPQVTADSQAKAPRTVKVDPVLLELETERIFEKFPQFDPNSSDYSESLDQTAADIFKANAGNITRLQAAREALSRASKMTAGVREVRLSNSSIKSQYADGGIATRTSTKAPAFDADTASLEETEKYLRANGGW